MGCQFDSSTCHNKSSIGKESNGEPPHKIHFPRKHSESCLLLSLTLESSMLNTIGEEGNGEPSH